VNDFTNLAAAGVARLHVSEQAEYLASLLIHRVLTIETRGATAETPERLLGSVQRIQEEARELMVFALVAARASGRTWEDIAHALHISGGPGERGRRARTLWGRQTRDLVRSLARHSIGTVRGRGAYSLPHHPQLAETVGSLDDFVCRVTGNDAGLPAVSTGLLGWGKRQRRRRSLAAHI
jgi:hypothetical protein